MEDATDAFRDIEFRLEAVLLKLDRFDFEGTGAYLVLLAGAMTGALGDKFVSSSLFRMLIRCCINLDSSFSSVSLKESSLYFLDEFEVTELVLVLDLTGAISISLSESSAKSAGVSGDVGSCFLKQQQLEHPSSFSLLHLRKGSDKQLSLMHDGHLQ